MTHKPRAPLAFLYGPPGVGKLTVAREVAARSPYRVFHNHLAVDFVASVIDFRSAPFHRALRKVRLDIIGEAARIGQPLVFTYFYTHPDDNDFVLRAIRTTARYGQSVEFFRLTASEQTLLRRVQAEERRLTRKIADAATMGSVLERHDVFAAIPFVRSVDIDTERLSPEEAAGIIVERLQSRSLGR